MREAAVHAKELSRVSAVTSQKPLSVTFMSPRGREQWTGNASDLFLLAVHFLTRSQR